MGWVWPRRCPFVEPVFLWRVGGGPPAGIRLRGPCCNHRACPGVSCLTLGCRFWSISKVPTGPTVCMDLAGRAIDTGRGARNYCVCAEECGGVAGHRRLPGNPNRLFVAHAGAQAMRGCADCGRLQGGCGRLQTEHGRCAQAMRHGADCGRLQGGCGRLQTEHGQIRTRHCRSHVPFTHWELPGAVCS